MTEHRIKIKDGHIQFVYDDQLAELLDLGNAAVCRVSHVEPYERGGWYADMSPVGGPVIFANCQMLSPADPVPVWPEGFKTRAEALAAERKWLTANKGL